MPLVRVRYAATIEDPVLEALRDQLPEAVAAALTCDDEGGNLTADDIEVFFDQQSRWDVVPYHVISLDVEAMEYPDRARSLERRTEKLRQAVATMLDHSHNFGLWVKLVHAYWTATEG
jgi:hypothetical protein